MASLIGFGRRLWTISYPPQPAKDADAIRVGLFGASWIAPNAIITPAKSHSGVIIAAVAARDLKKAQAYAKKHGIPNALGSYQELLDDPTIDAVYIPLPNGLHYEWTIRALRAGKHVLVEKPFVANAHEATSLASIHDAIPPAGASQQRPVLLEAVHYLFHPAWQTFLSLLSAQHIASAHASLSAPQYFFAKDDIRFVYALAGGTMMDMGTYAASALRQVFGGDVLPEECTSATPRVMPKGWDQQCDQAMRASFRFPGGATAEIDVDLAKAKWGVLPGLGMPCVIVKHKEMPIADLRDVAGGKAKGKSNVELKDGESHAVARTATMWNFALESAWHRIDIHDEHTVKSADGKVVKKWSTKESKKAYTWGELANDGGEGKVRVGEDYWSTYRYMLEEFVNKIKGRQGSGVWVDRKESINGMIMIDQVYEKSGLPLRPTSTFE